MISWPTSAASPGRSRSRSTSRGCVEAGFAHVEVVDSGADLNAYAKIEEQGGCCGGEVASVPVTNKPRLLHAGPGSERCVLHAKSARGRRGSVLHAGRKDGGHRGGSLVLLSDPGQERDAGAP